MNSFTRIVIAVNLVTVLGVVFHKQGPTHKKLAVDCLEEIVRNHFHYTYGKSDENLTLLFTVILTENITSPAFEIQERILQKIHVLAEWYQIETISSKGRHVFESFTDCSEDEDITDDIGDCKNNFVINFKTNFYVMVVDSEEHFHRSMDILENSNTFSPKALYLVYIECQFWDYERVATNILRKMWEFMLVRTAVLIPVSVRSFNLYRLDHNTRGPDPCGSNVTMHKIDRCVNGHMINIRKQYYLERERNNYLNCTMGVISTPYHPFVIDEHRGFEIEVLRNIERVLNIQFNVTLVSDNKSSNWGSKNHNGTWSGRLRFVYEDYYIGIGNIDVGMPEAKDDFYFSRYYYMESLVYVVPIAEFVPKWRVLIAIFTAQMWGICIAIIVGFAICFYFTSKLGKEIRSFRLLGESFLSSLQITISHAVFQHPVTDVTRVFFLSMAIWSIIISSTYTCSLVYYLTNPIREHQPTRNEEFRDSFGNIKYQLGGITRYKELFNVSDDKTVYEAFQIYQTARGENDTITYWIGRVAEQRNIWTISSRLYASHLLSSNNSVATYPNGKPKVFVFQRKLLSYSVCMLVRKGHPLLRSINHVIKKLSWGGIVAYICRKYVQAVRRSAQRDKDDNIRPLSLNHLQGAFGLLVLGCGFGVLVFVMESVVFVVKRKRKRKVGDVREIDVRRKKVR